MIKTQKKTVEVDSLIDIICNKCGSSCILSTHNNIINANCLTGDIEGSFYSTHLEDMTGYKFHLCEKCTVELMDTFSIPAEKTDRNINFNFMETEGDEGL